MRRMVYILDNGVVETTEKAAKESGLEYTVAFQDIVENPLDRMSDKRKASRKVATVKGA